MNDRISPREIAIERIANRAADAAADRRFNPASRDLWLSTYANVRSALDCEPTLFETAARPKVVLAFAIAILAFAAGCILRGAL